MDAETNDNTEATNRFEIDGKSYEVPDWLDLDLDEWQIIYDYSGVTIADFARDEDPVREERRIDRLRNPKAERSFLIVALRRVRPDDDLETLIEDSGRVKLAPYLAQGGEEDENPTSANEHDSKSEKSSNSPSATSSSPSSKSSETQEEDLATIGTSG